MNLERIITVAPTSFKLKIGELKQVQVITDYKNIRVTMTPEDIVEWDNIHREFKGIKKGYVNIKFEALEINGEDETIVGEDYIAIDVSDEEAGDTIRYMFHNRATNRLVTIQSDSNEDLVFKLPKKSGQLSTDTSVELKDTVISTPVILTPDVGLNGIINYDGLIIASEFKLRTIMKDYPHTGTTWQYASDTNFKNILKEEYIHATANNPLTQTSCSYYGITTYIRVKYHSNNSYSQWSEPVKITWTIESPDKECTSILYENDKTIYCGMVNESNVIDNRDYRGNYTTLIANNIKTFNQYQQVSYKDKLYYATKTLSATDSAEVPGTRSDIWTLDTREKLPTVRWLMDKVGIGLGNTDNNIDTYTSDGIKVGDLLHKTDNVWLKFIHNGKMVYTTAKPICTAISWCDVAKRNAAYGNRTVLIGSRTYKIRLLSEEEYNAFFIDTPANNEALKEKIEVVDKNIIEDFREGPNRYVISSTGEKTSVKAGTRTCAYRPVLELIRKGDELFNKIPKCAEAEDEKFQYDPFTDTGYFGYVKDNNIDFISTEELMLYMSYTNGTKLSTGVGYHKFYWQGQVLYLTKKPLRYGGVELFLEKLNLSFTADMGAGNRVTFVKNDVEYIPSLTSLIRVYPWYNQSLTNWFEGSQWTLIHRIIKGFVKTTSCGIQIGDNWANYEPTDFYTVLSNEFRFQELSVSDNVSQSKTFVNGGELAFANGFGSGWITDDEFPLLCTIKTYKTINEDE